MNHKSIYTTPKAAFEINFLTPLSILSYHTQLVDKVMADALKAEGNKAFAEKNFDLAM